MLLSFAEIADKLNKLIFDLLIINYYVSDPQMLLELMKSEITLS